MSVCTQGLTLEGIGPSTTAFFKLLDDGTRSKYSILGAKSARVSNASLENGVYASWKEAAGPKVNLSRLPLTLMDPLLGYNLWILIWPFLVSH